jgi:hypothetical protein
MLQTITMQDFQVIASAALLAEHSMVRTVACQGGNPGKAFIREGCAGVRSCFYNCFGRTNCRAVGSCLFPGIGV